MIEEKKYILACSPLAEHLHFETRVVNINRSNCGAEDHPALVLLSMVLMFQLQIHFGYDVALQNRISFYSKIIY